MKPEGSSLEESGSEAAPHCSVCQSSEQLLALKGSSVRLGQKRGLETEQGAGEVGESP